MVDSAETVFYHVSTNYVTFRYSGHHIDGQSLLKWRAHSSIKILQCPFMEAAETVYPIPCECCLIRSQWHNTSLGKECMCVPLFTKTSQLQHHRLASRFFANCSAWGDGWRQPGTNKKFPEWFHLYKIDAEFLRGEAEWSSWAKQTCAIAQGKQTCEMTN
jgi:hypothetical protein